MTAPDVLDAIEARLQRWREELPHLVQPEREHVQNIDDIALLLRLVREYETALKRIQIAPLASDGVIATKALNEGERIKKGEGNE